MMQKSLFIAFLICFLSPAFLRAQTVPISGNVYDSITNKPIDGALITIKESGSTVMSDSLGFFTIQSPKSAKTLMISALTYNSFSFSLKKMGNNDLKFYLSSNSKELGDVVVSTGYTQQSRSKTAGSVTTLKGSEIANVPVASFDVMLQGRVPGLYVGTPTGQPGEAGRITLRGMGSINGDVQPLYIIDGVPVSNTSFSGLNPDDFETITVLKDAASTAQYGSRGANGVIVITTKTGRSNNDGKMNIDYKTYYGVSSVNSSKWDMMNTSQRLQYEEMIQDPTLPGWAYSSKNPYKLDGDNLIAKTDADYAFGKQYLDSLGKINTDWRKYLLRNGRTQAHSLTLSGNSGNTGIYMGLSYLNQQGVALNSGIERYSLRTNITNTSGRLKSNLSIGLVHANIRYIPNEGTAPEGGAAAGGGGLGADNPIAALYFALPYEKPDANNTGPSNYGANALNSYEGSRLKNTQNAVVLSLNESFRINNEFQLTSTLGLDYQQNKWNNYLSPTSYAGQLVSNGNAGMYQDSLTMKYRILANIGVRYLKRWDNSELEANILAESNKTYGTYSGFTGYGLIPILGNNGSAITPGTPTNNYIPSVGAYTTANNLLLSQIALLRYSWDNKYTLSASLRRDGTSQTPASQRNILLYALGGKWNVLKENFMAQQHTFSNFQVRASYGLTANGNGFASDFGYRNLYGVTSYNGNAALAPITPGNNRYTWESNKIADVGLELGFFDNRLNVELDFYNRITNNLFVEQNLSLTTGWPSLAANGGKVRNRGIEAMVQGDIIRNKDVRFSVGFNLAYNKNTVLSLGGEDMQFIDEISMNKVGSPLGSFYAVRWKGVDPQSGAPIYLDKDGKETNTYNPADAVPLKGTWDPPYKGGVNLAFSYKNFSISTLVSFIHGMYRLNYPYLFSHSADPNYRSFNQSVDMLGMWQQAGDRSTFQSGEYASQVTSRDVQSADYIKLRNVSLDYTVPLAASTQRVIRKLKVFVQGQNLISIMKWRGFDPEDANDIAQYEYPMPRTITAGVSISF